MDRHKLAIVLILLSFFTILTQGQSSNDSIEVYRLKLDYNVPESPAFSILDANPTTVMRANAAQEVVINLASNFISGNNVDPGLAVDFNPYFVFGGRFENIKEYRERSNLKRILANTQLSLATISSNEFPEDLFLSGGIRVTLFDSKDLLFDDTLLQDIRDNLGKGDDDAITPDMDFDPIGRENEGLKQAYVNARERYTNSKGGSISLGYALASRAINNSFKTDSIVNYRQQAWVAGQYDFGKSKMSINSMLMYRLENGNNTDENGLIAGIALRHYGDKIIITGEIIYDGLADEIGLGGYIEAYVLPNISIYASLGKDNSKLGPSNSYTFKPGVKWNLSETKK